MYIIVGLGNPGREYANTRHNAGFMTLDILADRWNIEIKRHNFRSVFGEGLVDGKKVVLAKPETFMNLSGFAVMDLVNWYKPEHYELIVLYDDADIPLGTVRIRGGGSSGTHNGMKSIIYQLGFDDFPRVRVGIGEADQRGMIAHVLGEVSGADREVFGKAIEDAATAAEMIASGKLLEAQARFNQRPPKQKGEPEEENEA